MWTLRFMAKKFSTEASAKYLLGALQTQGASTSWKLRAVKNLMMTGLFAVGQKP